MTYNTDIDNNGRTVCDAFCTGCGAVTTHYIDDVRRMCRDCLHVIELEDENETK